MLAACAQENDMAVAIIALGGFVFIGFIFWLGFRYR